MAIVLEYQDSTAPTAVITTGGTLADQARTLGSYDNTVNLDLYADAFLTVQYDSSFPAAGVAVAELYMLPADSVGGSPNFPVGGDGTGGSANVDPQKSLLVGVFETRNGSTSATETLAIIGIPLCPRTMRWVVKNISGKTMHQGLALKLKPYKLQGV